MRRRGGPPRRSWVRVALVTLLLALFAGRWLAITRVEQLWIEALGAGPTHAMIARLRLMLFVLAFAVAAVWCVGNLLLVYRSIGSVQVPRRLGNLEFVEAVPRRYLLIGTVTLGAAIALVLSLGAREWWNEFVLLGAAGADAPPDPLLRRSVGYYLFTLPWLRTVQRFLVTVTGVVAFVTLLLYGAVGALQWSGRRLVVAELARTHLAGVLTAFAAALFFGFRLDPAEYVAGLHNVPYDTILVAVRIPVANVLAALALLVAFASLAWVWIDRVVLVAAAWVALALASFVGRYVAPAFAAAVRPAEQRVLPDLVADQRRFLGIAYGLASRDTVVEAPVAPDPAMLARRAAELTRAPVWDEFVLVDLLNRVARRRPHDRFEDATLALYRAPGGDAVPLLLAVRQVDFQRVSDTERELTWQELHQGPYAHAVGAVAVQAHAVSESGLPLFVPDLSRPDAPTAAVTDLALSDSVVRFGPSPAPFSVATDAAQAAGIAAGGGMRRVALAWVLQSPSLLSRRTVAPSARILWRRSVVERLEEYAPFAEFGTPYPVVTSGRLRWLADGYLRAGVFPLAILTRWRGEDVRYLRASLLGVVDAQSGETSVFLLDASDPLGAAWAQLAPDVVQPGNRLPEDIRSQVRYPTELFRLQLALLLRDPADGLPVLRVRRPPPLRGSGAPDAPEAGEPAWVVATFPGDTGRARLRLRAAVRQGDPPLLAQLVDGVMDDGRPLLEVARLGLPLVHAARAPSDDRRPSADGTTFDGVARSYVFADGLITVRSTYTSAETANAVPRLVDVTVALGGVEGRGRSLPDALRRARAALRTPTVRGAQWAELRDWFDRMDAARAAGDWAAFGRAYEQLRRLLGVGRDTAR